MAQLLSNTRIYGFASTDGQLSVGNVTSYAATSNTTGSLIVIGGVGILGNTYTGNLVIAGSSAAGNGITFADGTRMTTAGGGSSVTTFNTTIGDGTNTTYRVLHNLAKTNIVTTVRETTSGNIAYPSLQYANTNQMNVSFVSAPSTNFYTVSIMGF